MNDLPALIARTAAEAWEKRSWWISDDPPATLTLLDNGEWYYTEHGQFDVLAPGEHVLAAIVATPAVLATVATIADALHAATTELARCA